MEGLYELRSMLCNELEKYGEKGEMTAGTLDIVDKLAHAVKNIDKIIAMSDDGYSGRGSSYRSGMYARTRDGSSYARQKRDSMGRYSRHDGKSEMVMSLEDLMTDAPNDRIAKKIEQLIDDIQKA